MQDKNTCCNQECNQGRDCPVRNGTHKPAEAVHQIQEPAPVLAAQPSDKDLLDVLGGELDSSNATLIKFARAVLAKFTHLPQAAPAAVAVPAMNEEGYLPCPFCSSDQVSLSTGEQADGEPWYYVECGSCTATAEPEKWDERALKINTGD